VTTEKREDAKEFVLNHWGVILGTTLTLSGAAILAVSLFLRQKALSEQTLKELNIYEQEAKTGNQDGPVFLETGSSVMNLLPNSNDVAKIMAESVPDKKGQEVMSALGNLKGFGQKRRG
jgi:hypothetical protein